MLTLKHVLLIDDNEADNFLHRLILTESGMVEQVTSVESAEEGLTVLGELSGEVGGVPDVVFLDINMPSMSGWEFLERLPDTSAKVILLTTSSNPDDRLRSKTYETVLDYVEKPLTIDYYRLMAQAHFS